MNVVDSSAWLEFFGDGPQAARFAPAIEDVDALVVPSIVILEVVRRILQQRDESDATRAAAAMQQGRVVPLDEGLAFDAALLGKTLRLPLADSVILATARRTGATVWTLDADFKGLPDVRYFERRG